MATCFDWTLHLTKATKPNTVPQLPVPGNRGGDNAARPHAWHSAKGLKVLAPVHDAFLIEADAAEIGDHVAEMQACMDWASAEVLGGLVVRVDPKVIHAPHEHYYDERGDVMYGKMTSLPRRLPCVA